MTRLSLFCIVSSVVAIAHAGRIPEEKLLAEEALEELTRPHHRHFAFELGPGALGTYETAFDIPPPPPPPVQFPRESRTRFRFPSNNQRSSNNNNNNNRSPIETNELSNGEEDLLLLLFSNNTNDKRIAFLRKEQRLEDARDIFAGVRRKRDVVAVEPGSGEGKVRNKRTHCHKCGGGGYGGGGGGYGAVPAVPVYAVAVPVYSGGGGHRPSYGGGGFGHKPSFGGGGGHIPVYGGGGGGGHIPVHGGGGGCNTCGGGGFGGHGGSFSQSSSHSSSSSSSFGYGKK